MSGLEILREVAEANAEALADAQDEEAYGERREGVPVEMWRQLQ